MIGSSAHYLYVVSVVSLEAPDFDAWHRRAGVRTDNLRCQTSVIDPKLTVGSLSDTVAVNEAAPLIATEGTQVFDVKDALRTSVQANEPRIIQFSLTRVFLNEVYVAMLF